MMNNQVPTDGPLPPIAETHRVADLAALRLLADPLKLRLLQVFGEGPCTTMQAAQALGENLTKLYRHVDALTEAGLLEVVSETRKRGTVERSYRAVAKRFEVERGLLGGGDGPAGEAAIRGILRDGEDDIVRAFSAGSTDNTEDILLRLHGKLSPRRLAELRQQLVAWLDAVQIEDADDDAATEAFSMLLAFYRSPVAPQA